MAINRFSNDGRRFLSRLEGGIQNRVYLDSNQKPTVGVGHLLKKSELSSGKIIIGGKGLKYFDGLTDRQCLELFEQDLSPRVAFLAKKLEGLPIEQSQFDALLSFMFNTGRTAFEESTLLKRLRSGKFHEIPTQMRRWKFDNGKIEQGLINRREKEIRVWLNADYGEL